MNKKVSNNSRNYLTFEKSAFQSPRNSKKNFSGFLRSKKASLSSTEKIVFFIPVVITFGVIAVILGYVAYNYYQTLIFIPDGTEEEIIFNRFFSSPSCFVYEDPYTGRAYPGIIDEEKFTHQRLQSCYDNPQRKNVQISIQLSENNEFIKDSQGNQLKLMSENFRSRSPEVISRNIILKSQNKIQPAKLFVVMENR